MTLTRRRFLGAAIGGAAGGLAGYAVGDSLGSLFGGAETVANEFKAVYNFDKTDKRNLDVLIESIPQKSRETYQSNLEQRSGLYQSVGDYIEALERQSLKIPTPGKEEAANARGGVRRLISGLFGEKEKKEAEIRSKDQYATNYNDLARLRVSLMDRIAQIEKNMNKTAYNVQGNEHNTHMGDETGRTLLGDLFREHENSFALLRGFKELTPEQVLAGINDRGYAEVIRKVSEYGIKPYEPNGFLTKNAALGITVIGAAVGTWAGNFVTGKGEYAVKTAGSALRDLGKMALMPLRGLGSLVRRRKE